MAPGIPAEEDAPAGSELDAVVPVEDEVWGAEPGVEEGLPALGLPLDWLEEDELDEDEEEEDEEGLELDELDELELGIPLDELLDDDVAQPARTTDTATARRAARRRGTSIWVGEPFIAVAPRERGASLSKLELQATLPRVSPECDLGKLNAT